MARMIGDVTSEIPCNLCGNHYVSVLATTGRDGEELRTVICRNCGFVWSDPFPMDVREYYRKDYRLSYKGTYEPMKKHVWRAAKVAINRYQKICSHLKGRRTLLDVGSGGGEFLYLMHSIGMATLGIEPNEGYGEYSRREYGLDVSIGFAQNHDYPPGSFDLITMWHVLEHTDDPVSVLRKIRGWLKEDGMLVVEVPNVESVCQMPKSTFHSAHLFNFNHVTLEGVAARAGLHVVDRLTSEDGGNITQFLQSVAEPYDAGNWISRDNYERVASIRTGHTNLSHYLSAHPYRRLFQKLRRSGEEKRQASPFQSGKPMLDACYKAVVLVESR